MSFVLSSGIVKGKEPEALGIAIAGDRIAMAGSPDAPVFPSLAQLPPGCLTPESSLLLGELHGKPLFAASLAGETVLQAGLEWRELRPLFGLLSETELQAVSAARELLWWSRRHRFCGCCGTPLQDSPTERARCCPACKAVYYPVIAPAVIVAITRGEELLLAHNRNFRPQLFSLIAGFVDAGETLEQCVVREAREETGIEVGRLRYVASQPWPHPNSLMLGFTAEWQSGELHPDGTEIQEAGWFRRDRLPEIPSSGTVARRLIDLWLEHKL
jgi:NAD+ diphosphatase